MPTVVIAEGMSRKVVFDSMRPTAAMSVHMISLPILAADLSTADMASFPSLLQNLDALLGAEAAACRPELLKLGDTATSLATKATKVARECVSS